MTPEMTKNKKKILPIMLQYDTCMSSKSQIGTFSDLMNAYLECVNKSRHNYW